MLSRHECEQIGRRIVRLSWLEVVSFLLLLLATTLHAQTPPDLSQNFEATDRMIEMRDGMKLHTVIYAPKRMRHDLPILFTRTPYGIDGAAGTFNTRLREAAEEGYIFAFQDIRGRYKSEGHFVMQRPPRDAGDPKAIDEGTDAYDTIDWLVKNVPHNNGRVGMMGTSYPGWLVVMAVLEPHPALKAVTEEATPADMFIGDDFHHNGAFRLSYGFEYAFELESSKVDTNFKFDRYDTFEWYLNLGAISNVNAKYFHGRLPSWNNFVQHPNYDWFWKRQALVNQLKRVTVPIMHVAGWWDQEDFYGPVTAYQTLEKTDTNHMNYLVVGPWNHGGWYRPTGEKLGNISFESDTSRHFRQNIQTPWFAYFLKDKGKLNQPEALTFQTGEPAHIVAAPARTSSLTPASVVSETPRCSHDPDAGCTLRLETPPPRKSPSRSFVTTPARCSSRRPTTSPSLADDTVGAPARLRVPTTPLSCANPTRPPRR